MKIYKFEISLTEEDVNGDEFFENAIARDGTGIGEILGAIADAIDDSNLMVNSERNPIDVIKLISYEDK